MVKKILLFMALLAAITAVSPAYCLEESEFNKNYVFEKMIVYDRNSADGKVTSNTNELSLALMVRNNDIASELKFTSLDFILRLENLNTGKDASGYIKTVVGQCQNLIVSPGGVRVAVCSVAPLAGRLQPGLYIAHGVLRASVGPFNNLGFLTPVTLDTMITVEDLANRQKPDAILNAIKIVNANLMNTQKLITDGNMRIELLVKDWGLKIYNLANLTKSMLDMTSTYVVAIFNKVKTLR